MTKRLQPKSNVLRELYLKSGNQCAFPECANPIVDNKGNFIGQICHIEAAEEGGERFNPYMSNEERREYDNLILMCYQHHVETNDVSTYTVDALKKMKKKHEEKYSNIVEKMKNAVVDYGIEKNNIFASNCKKLSDVMDYNLSDDENIEKAKVINKLNEKLTDIPLETRTLLGIMVMRSYDDGVGNCMVPLDEIEAATGKDSRYLLKHIDILNRRDIISEPYLDECERAFCDLYEDKETLWNCWNDIREFCRRCDISIKQICYELDFSVFDY